MTNFFKHPETGIEFHILWKNPLSRTDAELVMASQLLVCKKEGFKRWLESLGNSQWEGNVEMKMRELFQINHPPGSSLIVDDKHVAEILGCTP